MRVSVPALQGTLLISLKTDYRIFCIQCFVLCSLTVGMKCHMRWINYLPS